MGVLVLADAQVGAGGAFAAEREAPDGYDLPRGGVLEGTRREAWPFDDD